MKLLVVEDEPSMAALLAQGLSEEGYEVVVAPTAAEAARRLEGESWDLILLDWGLPDGDGMILMGKWRRRGVETPILMLTARGQIGERVTGLRTGADDYLVKPFDFEELLARVEALTRRRRAPPVLTAGALTLDERQRRVQVGDDSVELSPRELDLLRALMERQGDVLSRTELLSAVWGADFHGPPNVVDVYVGYVRSKLQAVGAPVSLDTVRGIGYRLKVPA